MAAVRTVPTFRSEELKGRQLKVTKRRATALLAAVTVVFVAVTIAGADSTWASYLQAAAEASMVGALADWFAVTALFRHPLGLPIPHTAVVVERKEQFGETLGSFIQESFLTREAIAERLRTAGVGNRLALWLAQPANAERLARHAVDGAVVLADLLRDDEVHGAIEGVVRERVGAVPVAPAAGRLIQFLTQDGRHHELLDAGVRGLDRYLDEHRDDLRLRIGRESPWWLPGAVEDRIFERLLDGVHRVLREMATDRDHHLRREFESRLARLASDLETSPELRERGEKLKEELLSHPQLQAWVASVWRDVKVQLRAQAADPDSHLRRRVAAAIQSAGVRLRDDPALAAKLEDGLQSGASYVADQFASEIASLVSGTIARWDAEETARRLELLLGPDLQYIRINGTVIGGAAGLLLHAMARALG